MFQPQKLNQTSIFSKLKNSPKNLHSILTIIGLLIGLWYLPAWFLGFLDKGLQSTYGFTLAAFFVCFGLYHLWRQRKQITQLKATHTERRLGHFLILGGVLLFPICRFALWSQAILWASILIGIALSNWGWQFYRQQPIIVLSFLVTVYPRPAAAARSLWEAFTPYEYLERVMAHAGAWALRVFNWPATASESFVNVPQGSVDVYWDCNGFDMALTVIAASLVIGLLRKQSRLQILSFMGVGIVTALLFNIPRVMLMTIALVHWGDRWLNFWQGPLGSQLFSGCVLAAYYLIVTNITPKTV
ncbi:cyanoexosortase C [Leptothoe sp. ISB3NOV94-8A]